MSLRDEVTFTGVIPLLEDSPGTGYRFTYKGVEYTLECWSTRNGSGQDVYTDGSLAHPFDVDDEDEWSELVQEVEVAYGDAWRKHVQPALDLAEQELLNKFKED